MQDSPVPESKSVLCHFKIIFLKNHPSLEVFLLFNTRDSYCFSLQKPSPDRLSHHPLEGSLVILCIEAGVGP